MARPTWPQLLHCYDNTDFSRAGNPILTIADREIREVITLSSAADDIANDINLYTDCPANELSIGKVIPVHVGAPKLFIGIFAYTLDDLLCAPKGYIEFPERFFVVHDRLSDRDTSACPLPAYKTVVSFAQLLTEAATFLDREEQTLYFFRDGKLEIPVRYNSKHIRSTSIENINQLLDQFADGLHRDQKLTILAEAATNLVKSHPEDSRFEWLLRNIDHLTTSLNDGYRLFVSSFSYDKIRTDVENASLEFLAKIHKTFVDIQGQLLGLPIASIVVASQMKLATSCGGESLTNFGVLIGAWVFVIFLIASIINQFLTLNAIKREIDGQKRRLEGEYTAISARFVDTFDSISRRVFWYRIVFSSVGIIGLCGGIFATFAYRTLMKVSICDCL